jgi:hypothetical protein
MSVRDSVRHIRICLLVVAGLIVAALVPAPAFGGTTAGVLGGLGLAPQRASAAYCASPEEVAILHLVNERRASFGLKPVVLSVGLGVAAEYHSADMGQNNYFSHTLYDGTSWSQNIRNHGYNQDTWRGENIAAGNSDAYATFMQWVNSPGHDANMRSPNFVAIGIGMVATPGSTWTWYWTQTFGGYVDQVALACDGSNPSAQYGGTASTPKATTTPTRSATQTATPTRATRTPTQTATPTRVATQTATPTRVATQTATPTRVPTQVVTPTPTKTPTAAPTSRPTRAPRG